MARHFVYWSSLFGRQQISNGGEENQKLPIPLYTEGFIFRSSLCFNFLNDSVGERSLLHTKLPSNYDLLSCLIELSRGLKVFVLLWIW